jgi:hypothetical protein
MHTLGFISSRRDLSVVVDVMKLILLWVSISDIDVLTRFLLPQIVNMDCGSFNWRTRERFYYCNC